MNKEQLGLLLCAIGAIPLLIAIAKLYVVGFYPDELPLYAVLGIAGAGMCVAGSWTYRTGRQEQ